MKELKRIRIVVTYNDNTLNFESFKSYIDKCSTVKEVELYGDKDVFDNPYIFDMINYAYNKDMFIVAYTSLNYKLDIIKKLCDDKLTLIVRIESVNSELYNKYTDKDINILIENIKWITKNKPNIKLVFQPVFFRNTLGSIDKIIPLAKENLADITPILPTLKTIEDEEYLSPFELSNCDKLIEHFNLISNYFGIKTEFRTYYPTPRYCEDAYEIPTIGVNGNIYYCHYMHDNRYEVYNKEKVDIPRSNYMICNIRNLEDINNIWNNNKSKQLRKKIHDCIKYEKIHPYDKDQYIIARKSSSNKDFDYCCYCLWRWNQCM